MILEYLQVDSQSVALLELLGRTYEHTSKREEAAAQYGRALEILLQEPDPEMPTRPVELYDKITVLAPESPLLIRFASAFSSVPSQPSSPSPDEAVSSDVAFTSSETPSVSDSRSTRRIALWIRRTCWQRASKTKDL